MKKIIHLLLLFALSISFTFAQSSTDDERLNQDLKILEEVMIELFKSGNPDPGQYKVNTRNVDVKYIEGFGIVLQTPFFSKDFGVATWGGRNDGYKYSYRIRGKGRNAVIVQSDSDDERDDEDEVEESDDMDNQAYQDHVIALMRSFLTVYGDLTSYLKPDEKILMIYDATAQSNPERLLLRTYGVSIGTSGNVSVGDSDENFDERISAEVKKKDLTNYKSGSLSEKAFQDKINIHIKEKNPVNDDQLEYRILGKIFQSAFDKYPKDASRNGLTVFSFDGDDEVIGEGDNIGPVAVLASPKVNYQRLEGLGVIYEMNMRSSSVYFVHTQKNRNGKGSNSTWKNDDDEGSSKKNEALSELYDKFITDLKRNMVEYGRTLRSLPQEEWLIVEANMPHCKSCDLPGKVEMKIQKKVLESYDKRSISLEKAMDSIKITKSGKASDKSTFQMIYPDWNRN